MNLCGSLNCVDLLVWIRDGLFLIVAAAAARAAGKYRQHLTVLRALTLSDSHGLHPVKVAVNPRLPDAFGARINLPARTGRQGQLMNKVMRMIFQ